MECCAITPLGHHCPNYANPTQGLRCYGHRQIFKSLVKKHGVKTALKIQKTIDMRYYSAYIKKSGILPFVKPNRIPAQCEPGVSLDWIAISHDETIKEIKNGGARWGAEFARLSDNEWRAIRAKKDAKKEDAEERAAVLKLSIELPHDNGPFVMPLLLQRIAHAGYNAPFGQVQEVCRAMATHMNIRNLWIAKTFDIFPLPRPRTVTDNEPRRIIFQNNTPLALAISHMASMRPYVLAKIGAEMDNVREEIRLKLAKRWMVYEEYEAGIRIRMDIWRTVLNAMPENPSVPLWTLVRRFRAVHNTPFMVNMNGEIVLDDTAEDVPITAPLLPMAQFIRGPVIDDTEDDDTATVIDDTPEDDEDEPFTLLLTGPLRPLRFLEAFAADNQNVHTAISVRHVTQLVNRILVIPVPEEYRWNTRIISKTPGEILIHCGLSINAGRIMMDKYTLSDNIYDMGEGIYGRTLDGVWQYIKTSEHKEDLRQILAQELKDNVGQCLQGNLSRICNVLAGYMEGVGSQESLAEILGRRFALISTRVEGIAILDEYSVTDEVLREEWLSAL